MKKSDIEFVITSAVENAIETVFVEKAAPVSECGHIARYSVQDVLEGNCLKATKKQTDYLEREAEKRATESAFFRIMKGACK